MPSHSQNLFPYLILHPFIQIPNLRLITCWGGDFHLSYHGQASSGVHLASCSIAPVLKRPYHEAGYSSLPNTDFKNACNFIYTLHKHLHAVVLRCKAHYAFICTHSTFQLLIQPN
jgi:hypothetical protein